MQTKKWFVDNIQKDWVVFDCGANIGYYSILFSRLASQGVVYAFEPIYKTHKMLIDNLTHNGVKNIVTESYALGKIFGTFRDRIFDIWGNPPKEAEYLFTTIDKYVKALRIEKVDCIKIDTDSFDFEVLQGAKETILKFNPYIMVELNYALSMRGQTIEMALAWLSEIGYSFAEVFDNDNFLLKGVSGKPSDGIVLHRN